MYIPTNTLNIPKSNNLLVPEIFQRKGFRKMNFIHFKTRSGENLDREGKFDNQI
jgi:hypothetical protein